MYGSQRGRAKELTRRRWRLRELFGQVLTIGRNSNGAQNATSLPCHFFAAPFISPPSAMPRQNKKGSLSDSTPQKRATPLSSQQTASKPRGRGRPRKQVGANEKAQKEVAS